MANLPGSTWAKIAAFWRWQWKWSKDLVRYENLPDWLKDNKFLLSKHRLPIYIVLLDAYLVHSEFIPKQVKTRICKCVIC